MTLLYTIYIHCIFVIIIYSSEIAELDKAVCLVEVSRCDLLLYNENDTMEFYYAAVSSFLSS